MSLHLLKKSPTANAARLNVQEQGTQELTLAVLGCLAGFL